MEAFVGRFAFTFALIAIVYIAYCIRILLRQNGYKEIEVEVLGKKYIIYYLITGERTKQYNLKDEDTLENSFCIVKYSSLFKTKISVYGMKALDPKNKSILARIWNEFPNEKESIIKDIVRQIKIKEGTYCPYKVG